MRSARPRSPGTSGFDQISPSHEASRLIKLVGRGDTAVVDAYLSPILRRYVRQVADALDLGQGGCDRLYFMQSNGGLTDAALFQGRDAILSGPAGGVVGMVRTGREAGFDRLIGFDMGGTSTDVCHYAGNLRAQLRDRGRRRPDARADDAYPHGRGRRRVDPELPRRPASGRPRKRRRRSRPGLLSQGRAAHRHRLQRHAGQARPGAFSGRLRPELGRAARRRIVAEKFAALAEEIGDGRSPHEVAEGFLRIAVENMANAIKKISVQRGYDVTKYALASFGGAGGQHACLVADALGMKTVIIHPFAGVLSAYGMGLADIRAIREVQFSESLNRHEQAEQRLSELAEDAHAEVEGQGIDPTRIRIETRAHLRYAGSHQALAVPFGPADALRESFEAEHRSRFGFVSAGRDIVFDMLEVEAIGATDAGAPPAPPKRARPPPSTVSISAAAARRYRPRSTRATTCRKAARIDGPAIVSEASGTTVIEPGWQGRIDALGNLVLERVVDAARETALGTDADPVMLEVFNNLFMNIAEQMGATLQNTAYSVNIKERLDFSCALFDAGGNLVANAPHVPVHLGSMSDAVRTVARLNAGDIAPGDAFMLNAPFNGGTHLPDVTVITPVFGEDGDGILFWVGSRGHHADIGGKTPGSGPPDSTHIEEEGVLIDNFRLVRRGTFLAEDTRALLASGPWPCRNVDQNMADLEAQIAANETGIREVRAMIANFGLDTVLAYMRHVQDNAEASVRRVIGSLTDGACSYPLDDGSEIRVAITVDRDRGEAVIDFTGTSPQHPRNYNAPKAIATAAVLYVFRTLVGRDIPLNEGCLKPLRLILPERSMINPEYPAAVIAGNTEVSQAITEALYGALDVIAGSQGTMNNFIWGNERFQNYETIAGGSGAGPGFDGAPCVQVHMTNTRATDPEVLETRFPVRVERMAHRSGSGGAGKWTGGEGMHRILRFLDPVTVTTLCSHRIVPVPGREGGHPGAIGENRVLRADGTTERLDGNARADLAAGDAIEMLTPGGGGWGEPD
jgi:5-oxoprolinase (ATP-hydrolysing)